MNAKNTAATPPASLLNKDFTLVVIGQIISLFGNAILRFALPLYILNQSGSAALFGIVSAVAFIPMLLMTPIGGIIADRVNKQRIMVALDTFTTLLLVVFLLLNGTIDIVPLVVATMMLLYGIQGAYSPAVQASIPLLVNNDKLVTANAVVNMVQSLSALLGPVIGGVLYGAFGLWPILAVSCGCFAFSAFIELFIRIPHKKQDNKQNVFKIVAGDIKSGFHFIAKEKPILLKGTLIVFAVNLFMSSMLMIGMPVLITEHLGMSSELYGISEGFLGAGGLLGGLLAGVLAKKLNVSGCHILLGVCALVIIPMGLSLLLSAPAFFSYIVITAACTILMTCATMFSIQMLSYVQSVTPTVNVGKVVALVMAVAICAQPLGQALYGMLFEAFSAAPGFVVLGSAGVSLLVALYSRSTFQQLEQPVSTAEIIEATEAA